MDAFVHLKNVDDPRRDVTAMQCFCAVDLSQSTDFQLERARASSGLHSWLGLWCSGKCQDKSVGRIQ